MVLQFWCKDFKGLEIYVQMAGDEGDITPLMG